MNKFFYSLSLLLFFFLCEELRADTVITEIRTEQLVAPVGIDAPAPRLSWQITSTERNVMVFGSVWIKLSSGIARHNGAD